jgi:hypothetical protein
MAKWLQKLTIHGTDAVHLEAELMERVTRFELATPCLGSRSQNTDLALT